MVMEVVQERGEIDEIGEMWNNQRRDNIEKGRKERGWDPEWRGEPLRRAGTGFLL